MNQEPLSLSLRDGVQLRGTLWFPSGPGPWPALLMRQPYGHRLASTLVYAHPAWYASQGYLVLVQDVRGQGDSEGIFQGFAQEAADGTDTLAFLRSHHRCNGRVGSYGFSYQGLTQLLCDEPPLAADCLAPAMTGLDERLHWACEGGTHRWGLSLAWGLQLAAQHCQRQGDRQGWIAIRRSLVGGAFPYEGLDLLRSHDRQNPVLAWLERDPGSEQGWPRHGLAPELLRRPLLLLQGWHDPYLCGGLDLWQRSRLAGGQPLLRISPWAHLGWDRRVGGQDLGAAACSRVDEEQLAFFDRHLRDREPGTALVPSLAFDLLAHHWRAHCPLNGSGHRWGLESGGLAASRSDEGLLRADGGGAGSVHWVHDPWRPVPGRGGHLGLDAGPVERGDLDGRADVVCFSSPPLTETLELWGQPLLELQASADGLGFDLCAALSVVRRQGAEVLQLSTGVSSLRGDHCQKMLWRQVRLQPLLASLAPGDSLRISLAAAAWPQIRVNPGDGFLGGGPAGPDHRQICIELQLAGAQLSLQPMVTAPPPGQTELL